MTLPWEFPSVVRNLTFGFFVTAVGLRCIQVGLFLHLGLGPKNTGGERERRRERREKGEEGEEKKEGKEVCHTSAKLLR